ncbi:hypothetical protein F2Q69_00035219 [Brassica cretica]|uniref:Uncharacterized protein n=1 Tax=Brassica cretica TaxID=69181 RepID=A0A8S9SRK0_BRACR|nr:hypothetical protein F2Q69_00035219 [Brassica cretica]
MSGDELQIVAKIRIKLRVMVDVLQAVKRAVVPVILDVGGMDMPISNELSRRVKLE